MTTDNEKSGEIREVASGLEYETAGASQKSRIPRNLKPGTIVEDIYTGAINTVKCAYWQHYAGGNTSDYTVEFEPTQEQPTGWNKSTNLHVISTPEASASQNCAHEESGCTDYLQHSWASCPENKTSGKPELPDIEKGATLGALIEKHKAQGKPELPTDTAMRWAACEAAEQKLKEAQLRIHRPIIAMGIQKDDGTIEVTDVLTARFPDMTNEEMASLSMKLDEWSRTFRRTNSEDTTEGEANAKLIVASVNHAEALADALREIGHDFAEIRLWIKDQDVKLEAKLASVATLIDHANKKAIAARANWEGAQ